MKIRLLSRTIRLKEKDKDRIIYWKVEKTNKAGRNSNFLPRQSDKAATNPTVADQVTGDIFGHVNRGGKTNALGRENDSRIDTDNLCSRVDKGSPRVARVQSSVSLNNVVEQSPRLCPE